MGMRKLIFLATGEANDPTTIDFRILGLHKNEIFDAKGDLITVQYFTSYDKDTDTFTNLAVEERRVYTRAAGTGILEKRANDIDWFDQDGNVKAEKTQVEKYYSSQKGFKANKKARQNLLDKASMYLYAQLLTNHAGDTLLAEADVEDFDVFTTTEQVQYVKSTIQPLLTKITNGADSGHADYKPYMTEAIKTVLLSILNVSYA